MELELELVVVVGLTEVARLGVLMEVLEVMGIPLLLVDTVDLVDVVMSDDLVAVEVLLVDNLDVWIVWLESVQESDLDDKDDDGAGL